MAMSNEEFLNAPIPGESLTAEPRSRPWRRPAETSNVDDAIALYAPMFQDETTRRLMLEQIENGIPLTSLADLLITANAMEGRHSLDVGILISPVLIETMATFAEMAEIDYVVGNEKRDTPQTHEEMIQRAVKSAKKISEQSEDTETETLEKEQESVAEKPEAQRGLMAPRKGGDTDEI